MAASPVALIPVNRFDRAKGRLSGVLSADERAMLAVITATTVVAAARGAGLDVWLLGPDTAQLRRIPDATRYLNESARLSGLNAQLSYASRGLYSVIIVHADLPLATSEGVTAVLAARPVPRTSCAVAVESPDGGTNAMLLEPAGRFPLVYGFGSFAKHRAAAAEAGVLFVAVRVAGLELDLDTPGDLSALLSTNEGRDSAAGRFLREQGVEARLAALGQSGSLAT